mmetsp:Transcript_1682/g.4419  ORF Transcript_1682/g.4419 Transcript_1682/m.4419 type:complete len:774 (+) Transcript_1682:57-2378(+)
MGNHDYESGRKRKHRRRSKDSGNGSLVPSFPKNSRDPLAVLMSIGVASILFLQFATFYVLNESFNDPNKFSRWTPISVDDDSVDDASVIKMNGGGGTTNDYDDEDGDNREPERERELMHKPKGETIDSPRHANHRSHDEGDSIRTSKFQNDLRKLRNLHRQHELELMDKNPDLPILVVGGSDGSGTRAVVAMLRELGCIIVSDDPHTFDVHLQIIHSEQNGHQTSGWPSLVERVFSNFGRDGVFQRVSGGNSNESSIDFNFEWPPKHRARDESIATKLEADMRKALKEWTRSFHHMDRLRAIDNEQRNKTHAGPSRHGPSRLNKLQNQPTAFVASSKDVAYVIKAPVSMLILPLVASSFASYQKKANRPFRSLKFLHVVRDGRDVALSENQSPVTKFYNVTYPQVPDDPHRGRISSYIESFNAFRSTTNSTTNTTNSTTPVKDTVTYAKAMQLWNDWNVRVHEWATDPSRNRADENSPEVDYMLIRSEDLLVPNTQERLDALIALANFVGSTLTPEELCVLNGNDSRDYGVSNVGIGKKQTKKMWNRWSRKGVGVLVDNLRERVANHPLFNRGMQSGRRRLSLERSSWNGEANPKTSTAKSQEETFFVQHYLDWQKSVNGIIKQHDVKEVAYNTFIRQGEELLKWEQDLSKQKRQKLPSSTTNDGVISEGKLEHSLSMLKHRKATAWKQQQNKGKRKRATNLPIQKRYGKWKAVLDQNPPLSDFFHREGAEGLEVFGYLPFRRMLYEGGNTAATQNRTALCPVNATHESAAEK